MKGPRFVRSNLWAWSSRGRQGRMLALDRQNLRLAILILLIFFAIRISYIEAGFFGDEFDNLAGGLFVSKGHSLYKDYFSHHFPFPYWWLAAVFKLFGPHVFSARFSLLVLEILSGALLLRLSGKVLPVALSLLIWGIISPFYFGHMVIYYSFSRIGFFFPFVLIFLSPITELVRVRTRFLIWVFTAIAIASDPLMIPPLTVVHLRWLIRRRDPLGYVRELALFLAGAGVVLSIFMIFRLFSLDDFWRNAILFNISVYRKYAGAYNMFMEGLIRNLSTGLELLDSRWFKLDFLTSLDVGNVNHHVFTGFFFRLAVLLLVLLLLINRRFMDALWIYGSAATLLAIRGDFFHSGPFVMTALFATALLIDPQPTAQFHPTLRGLIALAMAWLGFRAISGLTDPGFKAHFQWREWALLEAQRVERLACGRPEVVLGDYPSNVHLNFLTGRRPPGGYALLLPWMAEWGLQTVIDRLQTDPAIVRVNPEEIIWSRFRAGDYLKPLINFLDKDFILVDGFYVSPQIIRDCPSVRPYLNHMIGIVRGRFGSLQQPLIVLTKEPSLLEYVQAATGVHIRSADPQHALLVPKEGACFLAAPAWMIFELPSWGFDLQKANKWESWDPWPLVCLPFFKSVETSTLWENSILLRHVTVQGSLQPGGELEIIAFWQYNGADSPNSIHVFHHLLSGERLIAQADGPLNAGLGWQPTDLIGTRYRIQLPAMLPPGSYELRMGLYRWPGLERLKTKDGSDWVSLKTWKMNP